MTVADAEKTKRITVAEESGEKSDARDVRSGEKNVGKSDARDVRNGVKTDVRTGALSVVMIP